jgi:hypothetical protein
VRPRCGFSPAHTIRETITVSDCLSSESMGRCDPGSRPGCGAHPSSCVDHATSLVARPQRPVPRCRPTPGPRPGPPLDCMFRRKPRNNPRFRPHRRRPPSSARRRSCSASPRRREPAAGATPSRRCRPGNAVQEPPHPQS